MRQMGRRPRFCTIFCCGFIGHLDRFTVGLDLDEGGEGGVLGRICTRSA